MVKKCNPHEGCCNRHTCTKDLEKCCYMVRRECIIGENPNFIDLKK